MKHDFLDQFIDRHALFYSRSLRWATLAGGIAMAVIGVVLLFLLTDATQNRALYEQNYQRFFIINLILAAILFGTLLRFVWRLWQRLRSQRFGSRLLLKLAAIFALVGFAPGVLIYTVSYQFVSRSIESWFDVKVEGALDAGVSLGRASLDALTLDLEAKARAASDQLTDVPDVSAGLALEKIREQLNANDVILWSATGQLIASVGESRFMLNPEHPSVQVLRNIRQKRSDAYIVGLDDPNNHMALQQAQIKAFALVGSSSIDLWQEPRFLQMSVALPQSLVLNAIAVQEANREYQERALTRASLRRMYIATLTLSLFLAMFGAVLLAVLLGNQLIRPLLLLAEGVREVASGNLTPKAVLQSRDELSGLTRDFAQMTQQLADARETVEQSMKQVSEAHANLQTISDNLTAGVLVLDKNGVIQSTNLAAMRILKHPLVVFDERGLKQIPSLEHFASEIQRQFAMFFANQPHESSDLDSENEASTEQSEKSVDHWQQTFDLQPQVESNNQNNQQNKNNQQIQQITEQQTHSSIDPHTSEHVTLVVRGAKLPGELRLLVFDDISEVVSAQRTRAWGEVARRLAHEIKNPLTPIQLSAERLEMKLSDKLNAPEQMILTKSVKTIVDQVDAMKRLVNEFRDYARLPAAELFPLDLNVLIGEVLQLYNTENASVPVQADLNFDCPMILGDAQQLRQIIHNLLQNAQDATESIKNRTKTVYVRTQWQTSSAWVRLLVCDNGAGFPENILKRAFEPYVTTKSKGTGLGLAVVKKIVDEHSAKIELSNRFELGQVVGAQVSLSFPIAHFKKINKV